MRLCGFVLSVLLLILTQPVVEAAVPHQVFAHYMVCFATYGETLDGYKREIQEAQSAGIDGFALNVGAWSGPEVYYRNRVKLMYDAAESLQTGFKLFFSVEITNTTDIVDMVKTYAARTNTFRQNGKVVVSTFGQNSVNWSNGVFAPLNAAGISVCFVPHFWPTPTRELPGYSDANQILDQYSNILNGLFLFGAAGLPAQLAQCNSNYTKAVHAAGKISMASVTPHYWGCMQYSAGRRYFEFGGCEGLAVQWQSIIASQPDWVEIVSWNDFNESSYISPVENPGQYQSQLSNPIRYPHSGYLEFSKHYIQWFKTGSEPSLTRDVLFFAYRTHPKAAASRTNDTPVTTFLGNVQDSIYISVFLTAPAQLEVISGSTGKTNSFGAGIWHLTAQFSPGTQKFRLLRGGTELVSAQGPAVQSAIETYDFFPATGFAYATNAIPNPPVDLRLQDN